MLVVLAVAKGLLTVSLHAAVLAHSPQLGHLYYAALVLSLLQGLLRLVALEKALRLFLLVVFDQHLAHSYPVELVVLLLEDLGEDALLLVVLLSIAFDNGVVDRFLFAVHGERGVYFAPFNGALLGLLLRGLPGPLVPLFFEGGEGVGEVADLGLEEV